MGGVIGTVSTAMCFYPYNMLWITILWGVLGGKYFLHLFLTLTHALCEKEFFIESDRFI